MASPKSGKGGSAVAPAEPTAAHDADVADPGEVSELKIAAQEIAKGKYAGLTQMFCHFFILMRKNLKQRLNPYWMSSAKTCATNIIAPTQLFF